jgi:transcriptional regulator of met regulon
MTSTVNNIMLKDMVDRLDKISEKYCDLVWLARKDDALLDERPDIRVIYEKVCAKYPKEVTHLQCPNVGDWHHGFNSGMLACARLLRAYTLEDDDDLEMDRADFIRNAEENFPELDS